MKLKDLKHRIDRIEMHLGIYEPEEPQQDEDKYVVDQTLKQSYELLRKGISRIHVATYASERLGKDIDVATWSRRVYRYAEKNGLPRVGQRAPRQPRGKEEQ